MPIHEHYVRAVEIDLGDVAKALPIVEKEGGTITSEVVPSSMAGTQQ